MKKNNKPELRFQGYTIDWEQHKVDELLAERNDQVPKSDEYPLMAFIANEGVAPKGDRYDRSSLVNDTENKLYKKTEYGDFIYSSNNLETGSIGLNKYGQATISPVYSIFYPTSMADSDFLGRRLVRRDFINEMIKWRQGVIYGQWRIHESDFLKIEISVPSIEEQSDIGSFLDGLDNLITFYQSKYEKLINLKNSMSQKMFPEKGGLTPEIRFAGFSDSWKKCKFNEVFAFMQNNSLSRAELSEAEGEVMNVHYGDILVKYGEVLDIRKDDLTYLLDSTLVKKYQASILQNGDIIIADAAEDETVGKCSEIVGLIDETVLSGLHTIPCRPIMKFAEGYLGYYMNSRAYHDQLLPLIQGTKISSISKAALQDTEVLYPKSKNEQAQIGAYFRQIDKFIILHQKKIEKLRDLKAACMDKMFV